MADDLKVKVTIQGEDNLSGPAKSASKSLDGLNKSADNTTKSSGQAADSVNVLAHGLAGPVVAAASAVGAGLLYATEKAAEFDKTISGVAAVTGASADEMAQLRDLALDLGAKTSFSAKEAAEGLGELAKGGVSVADIMGGAATAALNLAAAGDIKVGEAAAIAANAMSLFNIEGKDMGKVVDSIAGFANATTGSVNDFKFALASVGSVAHLMGQDFDQTATSIALMGKAGLLGSDAGTSLKSMLMNLVPSTKAATAEMQQLGIITAEGNNQFLDAEGNFKDLRDISDILHQSMQGLSESEQETALKTIFMSDGIRAASILAEAGGEGFDAMADAMSHVSAETVAATRLDNLAGSMESLNGTVETAAISLGEEMSPAIREVADGLNKFLSDQVIPFIKEYGPSFGQQLKDTVHFLGMVVDAIRPLIGPIGSALRAMVDSWGEALDATMGFIYHTIVAFVNLKNGIGEFFDAVGTTVRSKLDEINGYLSDLGPNVKRGAEILGSMIVQGIVSGLDPGPLINRLQGIAGQALQAAQNAIQAHSPSQLFAKEVGLPMALGIVAGLEAGTPAVVTAAESLVLRGFRGAVAALGAVGQQEGAAAGLLGYDPWAMLATTPRPTPRMGALDASLYGGGGAFRGGSPWLNVTPNQAAIGARQGVAESLSNTELKSKMGDVGAAAWKAFIEATKTGSLASGLTAGAAMQAVVDAAKAAGVPKWQELGATLMEAFNGSLLESTEISRARVAELLGMAQLAVTAAQQIKTAAKPDQSYGAGTGGGGTGGSGGGGASTPFNVKDLAAAMAQQPIVIQLDGQQVGQAVRTSQSRANEQTLTYPSGIGLTQNGVGGVGGGGF